jgi:Zn-dependent M28 family amino/carboxypeptidase
LPGALRPAEYVLYGAHWDANGRNGPLDGDAIRNGAIDNAAGTAAMIEVARAFTHGKRPARSVVFAAWTAEEKGLLGSDYYAAHPLFPLATTAAMINLDPHVVLPAARGLELIGGGRVSLEGDLREAAAARGLAVVDEPAIEAGWYFRSDQFSFARRGVPALTFRAGRDLVDGGAARGAAIVADYNARRYHQPSDSFDMRWTFAGTAQEASVAFDIGLKVANSSGWPTWNADSEYGALRAKTDAERK